MTRKEKGVQSDSRSSSDSAGRTWRFTIVQRQQTNEEMQRFTAASDALLLELVRQQMGRRNEEYEEGN